MSMTLIQFVDLTNSPTSIEITSIPQSYTHLLIEISGRSSGSSETTMTFNGSSTGWSTKHLGAADTSVFTNTNPYAPSWLYTGVGAAETDAAIFDNREIFIPNYTSSKHKMATNTSKKQTTSSGVANLTAGLWSNTAAITSIRLAFHNYPSATYLAGTTVSVYGISAGSDGTTTVS